MKNLQMHLDANLHFGFPFVHSIYPLRIAHALSLLPYLQYTFSNWMWFFCGAISLNWSISISYWRLDIENHRLDANYIRFKLKLCMHARTVETFCHAIRQTYRVWMKHKFMGNSLINSNATREIRHIKIIICGNLWYLWDTQSVGRVNNERARHDRKL